MSALDDLELTYKFKGQLAAVLIALAHRSDRTPEETIAVCLGLMKRSLDCLDKGMAVGGSYEPEDLDFEFIGIRKDEEEAK